MTHLAHLSDLHLLEAHHGARRGADRRRLAYLSALRPHDAADRRSRALAALVEARRSGADHVLITGDLTEDGLPVQFELLAEVLHESGLPPSKVTLLPGNHDAYTGATAFAEALSGPLRAYAETSTPGVPVVLRDVAVLPLSTAIPQSYAFSAGAVDRPALDSADRFAADHKKGGRAVVLAMHHPPQRRAAPLMQWIDGFRDHRALGAILETHDHLHVVHGHVHETRDRGVRPGAAPRIFAVDAVVTAETKVRHYHARHGRLVPLTTPRWSTVLTTVPA